ncbi:MAG: T9SS type A sorting domain-containing protein [Candidatus Kapaibacterium sp.]
MKNFIIILSVILISSAPCFAQIEGPTKVCASEPADFQIDCYPSTSVTWRVNNTPVGHSEQLTYTFSSTQCTENLSVEYTCNGTQHTDEMSIKVFNELNLDVSASEDIVWIPICNEGTYQFIFNIDMWGCEDVFSDELNFTYSIPSGCSVINAVYNDTFHSYYLELSIDKCLDGPVELTAYFQDSYGNTCFTKSATTVIERTWYNFDDIVGPSEIRHCQGPFSFEIVEPSNCDIFTYNWEVESPDIQWNLSTNNNSLSISTNSTYKYQSSLTVRCTVSTICGQSKVFTKNVTIIGLPHPDDFYLEGEKEIYCGDTDWKTYSIPLQFQNDDFNYTINLPFFTSWILMQMGQYSRTYDPACGEDVTLTTVIEDPICQTSESYQTNITWKQPTFSIDEPICPCSNYTFTIANLPAEVDEVLEYEWSVSGDRGFTGQGTTEIVLDPPVNLPTTNTIALRIRTCCGWTDWVSVVYTDKVPDPPQLLLISHEPICINQIFEVRASFYDPNECINLMAWSSNSKVSLLNGNCGPGINPCVGLFQAVEMGYAYIQGTLTNDCGTSAPSTLEFYIDDCNGPLSSVTDDNSTVKVYPNPAGNNCIIELNNSYSNVSVYMHDAQGRVVKKVFDNDVSSLNMNLTDVVSGIYVLHIEIDGNIIKRKISVIK